MPSWQVVEKVEDLKIGDRVRGTVWTHSQKYFNIEGYEDYNAVKHGIIVEIGKDFFDIIIRQAGGKRDYVVRDPGTSGEWYVEVWR